MYEGWASFGGIEVINNERARTLAKAAGATWFKGKRFPTVATSLAGSPDFSDPTQAPWYDADKAEICSRFYGVMGLDLSAIHDSTRTAAVTENSGDGGVIGASRKGTRSVRARVYILAEGLDALEYARVWLAAVLEMAGCAQVEYCGRADVQFFTKVPTDNADANAFSRFLKSASTVSGPFTVNQEESRGIYGQELEWTWTSEHAFVYGPSRPITLDIAPALALILDAPINWVPYPSAELATAIPSLTNLVPNPSGETTVATTVTTNLVTNPSAETNNTSFVAVPGTTGVVGWTGAAAPSTTTAFGSWVIKTLWSTASTAAGGGVYQAVNVTALSVYSFGVGHVKASITTRLNMIIDWYNGGSFLSSSLGTEFVATAGQIYSRTVEGVTAPATATLARIKIISVTGTSYANWSIGSYLEVDGLIAHLGAALTPYFDGASAAVGINTYGWSGTAHASTSLQTAHTEFGGIAGTTGVAALTNPAPSTTTAFGTKVIKLTWSTASTALSLTGVFTVTGVGTVVGGSTYSFGVGHVKCSINQRLALAIDWKTAAGSTISTTVGAVADVVGGAITVLPKIEGVSAPANASYAVLYVLTQAGGSVANMSIGAYYETDGWIFVKAATLPAYFDGATAASDSYTYGWNGASQLSTSVRLSTATIMTNVAPQPGVELSATGWSNVVSVLTGGSPASYITAGQSADAKAIGSYGYRVRILGNESTAASGTCTIQINAPTVDITTVPAGRYIQCSLWAAAVAMTAGAASVTSLAVSGAWYDDGDIQVGSTFSMTADPRGLNTYSSAKIVKPAGATKVRVIAVATVAWASGASDAANGDVRAYADALTVAYFGGA